MKNYLNSENFEVELDPAGHGVDDALRVARSTFATILGRGKVLPAMALQR
jgi:hypothetical protein